MTTPCTVTHISPMLLAADVDQTVAFYRDVLGFTPTMHTPGYAIVERDGRTIHVKPSWSDEALAAARTHTEIYIEVRGILALWDHVKQFRGRFKIRDLFDQPYGMTEFHIHDPNRCTVFVGETTTMVRGNPENV